MMIVISILENGFSIANIKQRIMKISNLFVINVIVHLLSLKNSMETCQIIMCLLVINKTDYVNCKTDTCVEHIGEISLFKSQRRSFISLCNNKLNAPPVLV